MKMCTAVAFSTVVGAAFTRLRPCPLSHLDGSQPTVIASSPSVIASKAKQSPHHGTDHEIATALKASR